MSSSEPLQLKQRRAITTGKYHAPVMLQSLGSSENLLSRMKRSLSANGPRPTPSISFVSKTTEPIPDRNIQQKHRTVTLERSQSFSPKPLSQSTNSQEGSPVLTSHSLLSPSVPRRCDSFEDTHSQGNQDEPSRTPARSMFASTPPSHKSKRAAWISQETSVPNAPTPPMYWSRTDTYGIVPNRLRAHASVVVDDKMYVFGGTDSARCHNTLYTFELDTFIWAKPVTTGETPAPSRAHSMVAHGKYIYVFGGGDNQNYHGCLTIFDTETHDWIQPSTIGTAPCARRAHTSFIWNDKLYVFGGGDGLSALNDVYVLDLNTMEWSQLEASGADLVSRRGYHSAVLVDNKVVVYGGSDGEDCFSDILVLDLVKNEWRVAALDRQIPRLSHAAVHVGSYLFIIAGHNGSQYCNDLLLLNLVTMCWETRKVYGRAPTPRGYHSAVLYDSRLFIFGGCDGELFYNDVHILDLSACAYLPQITHYQIAPCPSH